MIPLDVILDHDYPGPWPDLADRRVIRAKGIKGVTLVRMATEEGRRSAIFRIDLPDGTTILAETTLRLLDLAVKAMVAAPLREGEAAG